MATQGVVYDHVTKWLAKLGCFAGNMKILEVGCGSGQYGTLFSSADYIGVDVPETWYQPERLPDLYCSADALPFQEQQFDFIFNVAAFDYFPNPETCLSEFYRVLKPGGKVIIFNYNLKTLLQIHKNCEALAEQTRASLGHHVFDQIKLQEMSAKIGLKCEKLRLYPDIDIVRDLKLLIRPSNFRNYLLKKRAE